MSQATQVVGQQDFSGGVNSIASPYLLSKKQVARARNMILDEHGSLSTRDGYKVMESSTNTTNPIVYHGVFTTSYGVDFPFAVQNDGTQNTLYQTGVSPWVRVGTFNGFLTPQAVVMTDTLIISCGYSPPVTWDGHTFSTITAVPPTTRGGKKFAAQAVSVGAKHMAFHLGSLWLWNTNAVTTTYDGPSSLRMSDPNNFKSWPTANQTFVSKDDGQVGMGMSSFTIVETGISPTAALVLFKDRSTYQFTGVLGSANSSLQRIKSDMGCVAPRTIQFLSGYGVLRLSHRGFALYNGVDDRLVSEEIRPFIFGHDDITGLNFNYVDRSWSAQVINPPLYIAACPTSTPALDRIFVYDLIRRAWTICDFPIQFSTLTSYVVTGSSPIVRAGTYTGGNIVRLFAGDTDDAGTAINWSFRTRSFTGRTPGTPMYWRRAVLDALTKGSQTVTMTLNLNGLNTNLHPAQAFATQTTGDTYGSATYGTATYGLSQYTDARRSFDIMRTAPSLYLDVAGTGFIRVRSLDLHVVAKKPTRMSMGAL